MLTLDLKEIKTKANVRSMGQSYRISNTKYQILKVSLKVSSEPVQFMCKLTLHNRFKLLYF